MSALVDNLRSRVVGQFPDKAEIVLCIHGIGVAASSVLRVQGLLHGKMRQLTSREMRCRQLAMSAKSNIGGKR